MAVAVHQHQVVAADHGVPDDLVGRGGAIDHEEGVVGAKVARGPGFGFGQGAGVIEQRAQLRHGNGQVRAQGVFPEELVKGLAHRAFAIGHAATVARGVPGIVGLRGVLHQGLEERRQQAVEVDMCGTRHLASEKRYCVFEQVKNAAQLVELTHGFGRGILQGYLFAQGENRQVGGTQAGQADQLGHVLQQVGILADALGGNQHAGQTMVGGGDQAGLGMVGGGEDGKAVLAQFLGDAPHTLASNAVGLDGAVHDEDGELEVLVHQVATSEGHGVQFRVVEPVWSGPASSRACPLPQDSQQAQGLCNTCGSGRAREVAGAGERSASRCLGQSLPHGWPTRRLGNGRQALGMRLQLLGTGHDHPPGHTPGNTANLAATSTRPFIPGLCPMPGQRQAGLATGHCQVDVSQQFRVEQCAV